MVAPDARPRRQVVCPLAQVDQMFATADVDGGGTIDRDEALQLWTVLGDARATVDPDSRIRKLKNISSSDPGANDPAVVATWVVTKEQFRSWCRTNTVILTFSTAIQRPYSLLKIRRTTLFNRSGAATTRRAPPSR